VPECPTTELSIQTICLLTESATNLSIPMQLDDEVNSKCCPKVAHHYPNTKYSTKTCKDLQHSNVHIEHGKALHFHLSRVISSIPEANLRSQFGAILV
jgi:hypothetical protein